MKTAVFQVNDRADGVFGVDQIFTFMRTKRESKPVFEAAKAATFQKSNIVIASDNQAQGLAAQDVSIKANKIIASTDAQSKSSSSTSTTRTTVSRSTGVTQGQDRAESKPSKSKTAASKYSKDVSDLPTVVNQDSKLISINVTANNGNKNDSNDAAAEETIPSLPAKSAVNPNAAIDDLLNELKEKHALALTNLQNIVDGYNWKRVKPLEDRLVKRKLQLADRKKAADSMQSGANAETEQRLITALADEIGEIQTEIEEAQVKAERTKEGFG